MSSNTNSETKAPTQKYFASYWRQGRNGGEMEGEWKENSIKQLYQELARWFALVVHPVNCLAWLFPDISWKSNKKPEWTCMQKVSPLLAMQELGFVLHCKSQHLFLNTNLLCKSLDTLPWISQNMPLWWINKCGKLVVYNVKNWVPLSPYCQFPGLSFTGCHSLW